MSVEACVRTLFGADSIMNTQREYQKNFIAVLKAGYVCEVPQYSGKVGCNNGNQNL